MNVLFPVKAVLTQARFLLGHFLIIPTIVPKKVGQDSPVLLRFSGAITTMGERNR